jgi:predicted ribosome quality control (RQC) complex YloA/Tae2 family protein
VPQDAFTLRRLCIELDALFKKGKINKINQPSDDKVIFTVYTGKKTEKLLIDVNPSGPRIGVIKEEKENLLTALNFCMLLRKHLLSAEINKIELLGFDRIVKITLTSRADFKDDKTMVLYVELMGRYSNIILTENDLVLGANRGINMIYNGVRPIIFGKPYILPPVNSKKEPKDLSLIDDFNSFDGEDLSLFITEKVQGIALSTAKEIVDKYYLPTPFLDFKILKYEYRKKNCKYNKQKGEWLYEE